MIFTLRLFKITPNQISMCVGFFFFLRRFWLIFDFFVPPKAN